MIFRRRDRRPFLTALTELFLPKGGWKRAVQYVGHRLRRLPDPPHRIARGIFAGVFISFSPLFGLHFLGAALIAWAMRGNVLAALLATFFGNPITMPLIALGSVEVGHWLIGGTIGFGFDEIFHSFSGAWKSVWHNMLAPFTSYTADWAGLKAFFYDIFLPYLVGGLPLGILAGTISYYASLPAIGAYQRLRDRQRRDRIQRAVEKRQRAAEKEKRRAEKALRRAKSPGDIDPAADASVPPSRETAANDGKDDG